MKLSDKPAFPSEIWDEDKGLEVMHSGMTLRQYYAGLAMQGFASLRDGDILPSYKEIAYESVKYADALISELEKENSNG